MIDPETNIVYVMSLSIEGTTIDSAAYRCLFYKESLPDSLADTSLLTGSKLEAVPMHCKASRHPAPQLG